MNSSPSLRALPLLLAYDRESCPDLVQDFFLPVLHRATRYDRTTYNMAIPRCEHQQSKGMALTGEGIYDAVSPYMIAARRLSLI